MALWPVGRAGSAVPCRHNCTHSNSIQGLTDQSSSISHVAEWCLAAPDIWWLMTSPKHSYTCNATRQHNCPVRPGLQWAALPWWTITVVTL